MGRLKKEESTFLSICSPYDFALLTGSEEKIGRASCRERVFVHV